MQLELINSIQQGLDASSARLLTVLHLMPLVVITDLYIEVHAKAREDPLCQDDDVKACRSIDFLIGVDVQTHSVHTQPDSGGSSKDFRYINNLCHGRSIQPFPLTSAFSLRNGIQRKRAS